MGPALRLNDHLLKWEGRGTSSPVSEGTIVSSDDNDDKNTVINARVLFETGVKQPVSSILRFQNVGTTSLYYNWKVIKKNILLRIHVRTGCVYMYVQVVYTGCVHMYVQVVYTMYM